MVLLLSKIFLQHSHSVSMVSQRHLGCPENSKRRLMLTLYLPTLDPLTNSELPRLQALGILFCLYSTCILDRSRRTNGFTEFKNLQLVSCLARVTSSVPTSLLKRNNILYDWPSVFPPFLPSRYPLVHNAPPCSPPTQFFAFQHTRSKGFPVRNLHIFSNAMRFREPTIQSGSK